MARACRDQPSTASTTMTDYPATVGRRGTGPPLAVRAELSAAAGYAALESDITGAIADDQATFKSAATSGANTLDPLEPVVIVVSLLMALGCVWGLNRRLAEYR